MKIGNQEIRFQKRIKKIQSLEAIIIRIFALFAGLIIVGILLLINGVNPVTAYLEILRVAFFSNYGMIETLRVFIPIFLIGLGLAIPFKAQIDNIGAEGQFILGAIVSTAVAFSFAESPTLVVLSLMYAFSFIAGALWALPVAYFRAKGFKGSDVVISFLMIFPAKYLLNYLVSGPWRDKEGYGFAHSPLIPDETKFPAIIPGTKINITIILALVILVVIWYLLFREKEGVPSTKLAYEINVLGQNSEAGKVSGMNFIKIALITMLISGGLAGIAGINEVAGNQFRLRKEISVGYGYTGIAVAYLGGLNPIGILISSFFMSGLLTGGIGLQKSPNISVSIIDLFNGVILFCVLIAEFFFRYRIDRRYLR